MAVLQARMGSARFPGKVLSPLAGAPMLQRLAERIIRSSRIAGLVVATTSRPLDDAIEQLCREHQFDCFRGDEHDVLGRFLAALKGRDADVLVRLTGDNPFVDGILIDYCIEVFESQPEPIIYASTADSRSFPTGLAVELVRIPALRQAARSVAPADREHVTWFVRRQPERFQSLAIETTSDLSDQPLTIDTPADYERLKPLFEKLYEANPTFSYLDVGHGLRTSRNLT
jgi:spore coat polysaccharide biosynthesis protein SpsF (cytidylyltransferase family)